MFHSARIKLTAWYLLIIMLVSVTFSVVIYKVLITEVERFGRVQRLRLERRLQTGNLFGSDSGLRIFSTPLEQANLELVQETKHRILSMLIIVNGGILVFSGLFGYLLAGRTLTPIQEMMDEQNRFISDASHELRTPLTSLKIAFEVYLRDKHHTLIEANALVRESVAEVNKLQWLAESLLQLAQYQVTVGPPKFVQLSLTNLVQKAVHKIMPFSQKKKISIEEDFQDMQIVASENSLTDVLVILLDNAVKYSPIGKRIFIKTEKTDGTIQIRVRDEGIGISKKDLPHIFDRFYRADSVRSKEVNTKGFGLGLAIAKKITTLHKGSIHAESTLGKGSTFTIRLPFS